MTDHPDHGWKRRDCEVRWIEAKIAKAVAAEREACAKACANLKAESEKAARNGGFHSREFAEAYQYAENAIRERSNVKARGPEGVDGEPRLVSYAPDGATCTLNFDGEEHYYDCIGTTANV